MTENKIYTTREVARLVGVTPLTIVQAIRRGTLKADKFGRSYVITEEELTQYLDHRRNYKYGGRN